VATAIFETTLDANLMELYHFRDCHLNKSGLGRRAVVAYYAWGPRLGSWCTDHPRIRTLLRKPTLVMISLWRRWHVLKHGKQCGLPSV
jgi:hypothetical protein